jgi:hypothetical protein
MRAALGPRVGIWGPFDLADYANLLVPRIFEHELLRRLPNARVFPYAPLGAEHPIAMDGGRPAAQLGSWTPARRAQLAEQLDLVAVGGSDAIHVRDDLYRGAYAEAPDAVADLEPSRFFVDGLGAELESRCPVVWHAVGVPFDLSPGEADRVREALASKRYVSVCDPSSRERLFSTGTEREIALVPDPAVLADRCFPAETLRKRLDYLRAVECYPPEERPLILQANTAVVSDIDSFARVVSEAAQRHPGLPIVLVSLKPGQGDAEFAEALAPRIDQAVYRLPAEVTLDDLVAAIANARVFVGSSLAGYSTALAFGVPGALLNDDAGELAETLATLLHGDAASATRGDRRLADAADEHFDTVATIAEHSWSERLVQSPGSTAELGRELAEAERRHDALLRAYSARGERLVAERMRFAELLDATEAESRGDVTVETLLELAEMGNRLETLEAEAAETRFERDQACADLERVRAERDELRRQLAREDRPPRVRRLLPRRA